MKKLKMFSYCLLFASTTPLISSEALPSSQESLLQTMIHGSLEEFVHKFSYEDFWDLLGNIESGKAFSNLSEEDFDKFIDIMVSLARLGTPPGEATDALENDIRELLDEIVQGRALSKFLQVIENLPDDLQTNALLFFELGKPIIENYTDFDISEEQYALLVHFSNALTTFMNENGQPYSIETPEGEKIIELAREVLVAFDDES